MTDPTPERWLRVRDAFDAVVDLPLEDRPAALGAACVTPDGAPDPALRLEVEAMLAADDQASVLDESAPAAAAALVEDHRQGERVGPWRVVRPIGEGGMGRVDLVERADGAYEQRAALKRLSVVAPSRVRRFLRERQILASLDHPGISRLLDGGVSEARAPYLVMEYVEGEPITDYAERLALGLRDRLRLFLQVCDAVAYAHRHLVVHRDLKPSNVLVGKRADPPTGDEARSTGATDDAAHVTLLDFGVARLLDADQDDLTVEGPGAPLTPGYAAPEQATGDAITTATDVWALGVLLYELIAGRRPFESTGRDAWAETVRTTDPAPPSRIDPTATDRSRTDLRRVRGDLDAICLTALRREPEARYASAHDLAADLRRYLGGETVQARPPSALYRARRFVGRHRVAVAAAALVVVAASAGTASTLWQARETRAEAARTQATATFLAGLFEDADPTVSATDTLSALDLLNRGAARLDAELADQPGVRAELYGVIGSAYLGLGRPDSARAFARRQVAIREPGGAVPDLEGETRGLLLFGRALFGTDPVRAGRVLEDAVAKARDTGDDLLLLDALQARGTLVGGEALTPTETVAVLDEAVALCRRVEGEDSPRLGRLLATLATKVSSAHQHGRIEGTLRDALAHLSLEAAPFQRSSVLLELADLLHVTGKADEARALATEALEIRRDLFGLENARVAQALAHRAGVGAGGPRQAERDARQALAIAERVRDGATTVDALDGLGSALTGQERHAEAAEVYRRRLEVVSEVYGTGGTRYAAASGNVARALHRAGRYDGALEAWDVSIRLVDQAYGPESAMAAVAALGAASTARAAGRDDRADELLERAYAATRDLDASSQTRATASYELGRLRLDRGDLEAALPLLHQAHDARDVLDRAGHRSVHDFALGGHRAQALWGEALIATGDASEGRRVLTAAAAVLSDSLGLEAEPVRRARAVLARE